MKRIPLLTLLGTTCVIGLLLFPAIRETTRATEGTWRAEVRVVDAHDVVASIRRGEKILFLDVREPEEFDEFHLPGAVSVPLRSLAKRLSSIEGIHEADLVIPYCLKDFRGFEAARFLQKNGVENVGILEDFGVRAWKRAGLPMAGTDSGLDDAEAKRRMLEE